MAAVVTNATTRFSDRVADYSRYRPSYPQSAIHHMMKICGVTAHSKVADIGSGTGLLTALLLPQVGAITAVEPNESMRVESDRLLSHEKKYSSVAGTAEATTLARHSVELITAAQAFHWFDKDRTQREFKRILIPGGHIVLIWNRRLTHDNEFAQSYEQLLSSQVPEYSLVSHANADDATISAFLGESMQKWECSNYQHFDLSGLQGRLQSSSYCPAPGTSHHSELMAKLDELFYRFACDNQIKFSYVTQLYIAKWE